MGNLLDFRLALEKHGLEYNIHEKAREAATQQHFSIHLSFEQNLFCIKLKN